MVGSPKALILIKELPQKLEVTSFYAFLNYLFYKFVFLVRN